MRNKLEFVLGLIFSAPIAFLLFLFFIFSGTGGYLETIEGQIFWTVVSLFIIILILTLMKFGRKNFALGVATTFVLTIIYSLFHIYL